MIRARVALSTKENALPCLGAQAATLRTAPGLEYVRSSDQGDTDAIDWEGGREGEAAHASTRH